MSLTVLPYNQIDTSNLVFEKKPMADAAKISYNIKYKISSNQNIDPIIQIPKMNAPFGIKNSPANFNPNNEDRYSVNFSITDPNFEKFLNDWMNAVTNFVAENSKELFKKEMTVEKLVEADKIYPIIKVPEEKNGKKYSNTFRCKTPVYKDGKPGFKVYSENKEEIVFWKPEVDSDGNPVMFQEPNREPRQRSVIDWRMFDKSFESVAMIKCSGISFVNKTIYCTFKLYAMKMYPKAKPEFNANSFLEDVTSSVSSMKLVTSDGQAVTEETEIEEDVEEVEEEEEVEEDD